MGLGSFEKIQLMQYTEDPEYLRHTFAPSEISDSSLNLPLGMKVGMEIESTGDLLETDFWNDDILLGWKAKNETTVERGLEVVSSPLEGTKTDITDIYAICNMLQTMGQQVSEECAGHIHISSNYLASKRSYVNLIILWANTEKILYEISNPPGVLPRSCSAGNYAKPISGKIEEAIETGKIDLTADEELDAFTKKLKDIQNGSRYFSLNFLNVNDPSKRTLEIRLPNGTLDPQVWIDNINLFAGIVRAAEELAQIQEKKKKQEITQEEQKKLNIFARIGEEELTERDILDIILALSVSEEKRGIYEQRYEVNSKLLESSTSIRDKIEQGIAKKRITTQEIKSVAITGPNAAKPEEIASASSRLNRDLNIMLDENNPIYEN